MLYHMVVLRKKKKGLAVSRRTDEVIPRHCKRGKVRSCVPALEYCALCLLFIHPRAPNLISLRSVPLLLSVGEMTLRLYAALNYSQNSARDLRRALNGA